MDIQIMYQVSSIMAPIQVLWYQVCGNIRGQFNTYIYLNNTTAQQILRLQPENEERQNSFNLEIHFYIHSVHEYGTHFFTSNMVQILQVPVQNGYVHKLKLLFEMSESITETEIPETLLLR